MSPRAFSFNSPHGACPSCQGLGATWDFDPKRIVPDDSLSLAGGAIAPWGKGDSKQEAVAAITAYYGIDAKTPFAKLSKKQRDLILQGPAKNDEATSKARSQRRKANEKAAEPDPFGRDFEGVIPNLRRRFEEGLGRAGGARSHRALRECPVCSGNRLRVESLSVTLKGRRSPIASTCRSPRRSCGSMRSSSRIARRSSPCASSRRSAIACASERRRRRLPHARARRRRSPAAKAAHPSRHADWLEPDRRALCSGRAVDRPASARQSQALTTLARLRDLGNTVIVVEHDEETIRPRITSSTSDRAPASWAAR
jgi:excinuclease ABC subunit A